MTTGEVYHVHMMRDDYLTEEKPLKAILFFSLPMMAGNLFQQFYTMADSIIVGRFIGENALASVGASYALTAVFISIAIGGSATNDGGMGCMRALGVRFLDKNGNELAGGGQDLIKIRSIDTAGIYPLVKRASFTIMCDVTNPLCGEKGATYTFGKQKGGTPEILDELEAGMQNYRDIIRRQFGIDMDEVPGAGAAGGLGAALMVFLDGKPKSGIETVLDLVDFDRKLDGVSLVVTGEGAADRQSVCGKVMQGVGMRCKKHNIPAVAIVGNMGEGAEDIYNFGINSILTTVNRIMPLHEALDRADELYLGAARRMFRMLKTGMNL